MLDAGFLQAEDADRHVSLAIGAVAVLAGPMPDFDKLAVGLAERILSVPRFRQVLHTQPLDLGAPRWVEDVDELANGIERAVIRLTAISAGHRRSTPVGTLALVQGN
jgi:diacylglycerol O-acyltransferase